MQLLENAFSQRSLLTRIKRYTNLIKRNSQTTW
eukprot:UN04258